MKKLSLIASAMLFAASVFAAIAGEKSVVLAANGTDSGESGDLPALAAERGARKIPIIDVTDLYYPPQDTGDNFDLLTAYALPEVDLKAVILDCTEAFRAPVAKDPGPGLHTDTGGPRDPGFIPVLQLNYVFNRNVPSAAGPFSRMKSPEDKMLDVPPFQQQGIELILQVLRTNAGPVQILSLGSAWTIAAAYNREPELFREKVSKIHLSAGCSDTNFLEWNVALDPNAIIRLLRSDLPMALYPCAANNARGVGYGIHSPAHSYDEHNTYYKLPNVQFIEQMNAPLRAYLEFAFARPVRVDYLRAMDEDGGLTLDPGLFTHEHYVWETAVWILATNRRLVRHADGHYRIVPLKDVRPDDTILPNDLQDCEVRVQADGIYQFHEIKRPANIQIYFRGDPQENERALVEALPALYRSFSP